MDTYIKCRDYAISRNPWIRYSIIQRYFDKKNKEEKEEGGAFASVGFFNPALQKDQMEEDEVPKFNPLKNSPKIHAG